MAFQDNSDNNFAYGITEEYDYISDNSKDLHAYIGIELFNISNSAKSNLSLIVRPVYQSKNINAKDIELINVSFCNGRIDRPDHKIHLSNCVNSSFEDATKLITTKETNMSSSIRNWSTKTFYYSMEPNRFKENEFYSFKIEYIIHNFPIKKSDYYTIYDVDKMTPELSKEILLPKKASIKSLPEKATPFIIEDQRWIIYVPYSNGWQFISWEIIPWYKDYGGYIISFLFGGIFLFIISSLQNNKNFKKNSEIWRESRKDIITKIRATIYNKRKRKK